MSSSTTTAQPPPPQPQRQQQQQQQHDVAVLLDPTEVALGISCYRAPQAPGFSAVSKARFSDFVVREIGMDGSVARLESVEPKVKGDIAVVVEPPEAKKEDEEQSPKKGEDEQQQDISTGTKRKHDETLSTAAAATAEVDWKSIQTELEAFVGAPKAEEVARFLQQVEPASSSSGGGGGGGGGSSDANNDNNNKFIVLDAIPDKETRRSLHQWIRRRLASCGAVADTADGGRIRVWRARFQRDMPNHLDHQRYGNNRNRGPKALKGKLYLQFVLYKENMDTGAAMQQISRKLLAGGGGAGRGGGRRGGGGRGGRGGRRSSNNNQQQQQTVRMGYAGNKDKRGITSQFVTVAARDCSVQHLCNVFNGNTSRDRTTTDGNVGGGGGGHTAASGGVGLLRVGNFAFVADELRLGRLRGNRFDVVLRNVQLDDDNNNNSNNNKEEVLKQAAESIRQNGFINHFGIQRFGKFHDTHLTGMAILKGDYEGAIDIIMRPKEDERDDIRAARVQWQKRFESAPGSEDGKDDRATLEKKCASSVLRTLNRFMHSENAVLRSLAAHPLDYEKAFSCITKTMRMMFVHALQSYLWNRVASFRVEKLGPKIIKGDLVFADANAESAEDSVKKEGIPDVKIVTEEDIAKGTYTLEDVVLPLIGVNTRDPENECGKMFDAILKENNLTREMIHKLKDRSFLCTGDYRKLICRPTDVDFEVLEYTDELQPLLQNDYMKLCGHEVDRLTGKAQPGEKRLQAMVVGFSLPSSSYATMFMRELMKRPTSSEYQSKLKLGGEDE